MVSLKAGNVPKQGILRAGTPVFRFLPSRSYVNRGNSYRRGALGPGSYTPSCPDVRLARRRGTEDGVRGCSCHHRSSRGVQVGFGSDQVNCSTTILRLDHIKTLCRVFSVPPCPRHLSPLRDSCFPNKPKKTERCSRWSPDV